MDKIIAIIGTALPVFLALGLGMLCRRLNFLTRDGVDTLKKVVVNITLPAVLVQSFATAEYSPATIILPVLIFVVAAICLGLGFVWTKLWGIKSRTAPFLATGFEAGMLGYALFALLFKDHSNSELAILDIGHTIFVFTLYKILLSGKKDFKAIGRDIVTSPILWAVFIGVLLGATGLYNTLKPSGISNVFSACADFVAAPTGMIILLTVGYDLVPKDIPWKKTFGLIAMRMVIMAIFVGLIVLANRLFLGGIIFEGAVLLLAILPPPYVIPVFADEPEERVQVSSALSALTLITVILFAALSVIFEFV